MNNVNSAYQAARKEKENREKEEKRKMEEFNNPTNLNLRLLIEQNQQQINLLKSQNEQLSKQLELAFDNEKTSKKDARQSKISSFIAIIIAALSLIATVVIAILK